MQFNEIYDKTKYAFENGEVFELLMGYKGYSYQAPKYMASVPTCDEFVFENGIYPYYRLINNDKKKQVVHKLEAAFREMMKSDDAISVWWALSLLYGQKLSESKYKDSPFFISDVLLKEIKETLTTKKEELLENKTFEGATYENGLWGDVLRINAMLMENFNISILGD